MTLPLTAPLASFFDRNGNALENGFLYIGTAGQNPQTNPISVYWDAALTIPAAQPFRVSGGYIYRNGTPANVYVGENCSITVRDRNGALVYTIPTFVLLSASGGSAEIGFIQAGVGAIERTVQSKLRDIVSVLDFIPTALHAGIKDGTNTTPLKTYLQAAHAASNHVRYAQGTYYCGELTSNEQVISVAANGESVSVLTEGIAKFTCETMDASQPIFFRFRDVIGLALGNLSFQDFGYHTVNGTGAVGVTLSGIAGQPTRDVAIEALYAKDMVSALVINGSDTTDRVTGIDVGLIWAENCHYGLSCVEDGDGLNVGMLYAFSCKRAYLGYGNTGVDINMVVKDNQDSSGIIGIARRTLNTKNIKIRAAILDPLGTSDFFHMNQFGETSGVVEDVDLHAYVKGANTTNFLAFRAYNEAGDVQNTGVTNNIWRNIRVNFQATDCTVTNQITIACQPSTHGLLDIGPGVPESQVNANVHTYFQLNDTASYTPTITAAGGGFDLSNGSISGRYHVNGGLCWWLVSFTFGSSSNAGVGVWDITLPFTIRGIPTGAEGGIGSGRILDSGTGSWSVSVTGLPNSANARCYYNTNAAAATGVGAGTPITWATNDRLLIGGVFPLGSV